MSSQRRDELPRLKQPDEIDDVFGRANPNPDRIGCPPRDVLVALARRERLIGDPAYDHLSECSPCYLEVRALNEAARLQRRRVLTWAAAAAGLVLATSSAGWFLLNRGTSGEPIATEVRTQLDLRPYALMRGETPQGDRPPLVLPRARVLLTLLLPTASEPGPYEVEIRDSGTLSKSSARGEAELRNQVTTLEVALDLRALSPGAYQIAVRRHGEDWQLFPAQAL
jgi:hypothetical protein